MKKLNSSLLLIAACTGLVLAGCQKAPVAAPTTSTENATGSIQIQDAASTQNAAGSMTITDGTKAAVDATAQADQAMKDATAATAAASAASADAMAKANQAMKDAGVTATTSTTTSATAGN